MKDSQGNEFGIEDRLKSSQTGAEIQCQNIKGDTATMVWLSDLERKGRSSFFNINQKRLLSSKWVKIKKEKEKTQAPTGRAETPKHAL